MELLEGLNVQQQQAVMAGTGPVLVLAGPGSGKTRVLTHRIAYLIGQLGVRPFHILAVTFTNKAAHEMENRIVDLVGQNTRGLMLGTFHATCARILRREADHLPITSNYVIFDADDQTTLVKRVIRDMGLDDKRYRPAGVHASISNAKNELYFPEDYPVQTYMDEVVKRVYEEYQNRLIANNGVDFDDLLLWTAHLLQENPVVRERYARRFEHILVDEFQDTNIAQYTLLRHLASFHRNIFVVGDADQSIYRWRGADYRNVLRFEEDFPDAQVILLEQNYRSTQNILDTAMAIIDQNTRRQKKELFTERGEGTKITLREAYDDREEASMIVDTIASMVARESAQPGDFAVMYRTNAQSRVLEEAFLARGLPYKLVGAQRFYGRREIKDIVAYLRLAYNPNDEISLTRVINTPTRGIGTKTFAALRTRAQDTGLQAGEILMDLARGTESPHWEAFTNRAASALARFGTYLAGWRGQVDEMPPLALMDLILDETDYKTYIDDGTDEGRDRWENIMELRRLAGDYQSQDLQTFLEDVTLISDQDTLDLDANAPTLLTLHAAKGLEFPNVFIVGIVEGTLPHNRSMEEEEELQEERRLFYVGITRAKNRLFLYHTVNRTMFGFSEPAEPSRFLADIPSELLDAGSATHNLGLSSRTPVTQWTSNVVEESIPDQKYAAGMKVDHPKWGEGMILNSRILDGSEILDIFFNSVGLKKLDASMAKLEVRE